MSMFTRRHYIYTIGFSLAVFTCPSPSWAADNSHDRPNILFIMADDHASHAISAYGSNINKTPNIDRLANEGMRFTNCFNVNALCAPSRACLITGRYSAQNGFRRNGDSFDGSQINFAKLMQKAGYDTALIGKWHLRSEPTGFDHFSVMPGHGRYFDPKFRDKGMKWPKEKEVKGYLTDVITDKAIDYMKTHDKTKPFCLMVHHKAPHTPHHYPKKYEKLFADKDLPVPENFYADYSQRGKPFEDSQGRWSKLDKIIPAHFNKPVPKHLKIGTKAYKEWSYQCFFKGYLRLVAAMDDSIGRLLDHVDESGLAKNTIVVYTSDNGFFIGDFGLFNKMWMYEESLRLPLLVRYPGKVKAKSVNDDMVSILDFGPTFIDYAKGTKAPELQGHSIRQLLEKEAPEDWRKAHYYHYYGQYDVPAHRGVRTTDYKLIHYYKSGEWELFDMKNDSKELQNVYDKPENAGVVKSMKKQLKELQKKFDGK